MFFLACWHSTEPLLGCLFIYLLVRERTGTSRGIAFNHLARSNNKRGGSNGTDVDIDNAREHIICECLLCTVASSKCLLHYQIQKAKEKNESGSEGGEDERVDPLMRRGVCSVALG